MAKSIICDLLQIFKASVSAVLPENLIRNTLKYSKTNQCLTICGEEYNLQGRNVYVVGFGKAVQSMANEVECMLSSKIKQGIISIPVGSWNHKSNNINVKYYEGAKDNLPDENAVSTAMKVKDLVTKLKKEDFLLVLISGGGSALLPLPKDLITLEEKTVLISRLAKSGADITELNCVRKRISDLKGGQLAIKAQPAQIVSLILSDIVGDPIDMIASGPTTENEDNPLKAITIIEKYGLFNDLPQSIKTILQGSNSIEKFPRDTVKNYLIGTNKLSIAAALQKAKELNYLAIGLSDIVTGEVTKIAFEYTKLTKILCHYIQGSISVDNVKKEIQYLSIPGLNTNFVEQIADLSISGRDLCLVFGGETTVEVKGTGKGGRNQQLALELSSFINNLRDDFKGFDVYILCAGTDGIDGPTDAAGAIGHLNLLENSKEDNINAIKYLDTNDSYNFYKNYKEGKLHVITGHTNTNVMDIHLIVIKRLR